MSERLPVSAGIHEVFASTEHGQFMRTVPRWARYMPEGMEFGEWQRLLGIDVNSLGHLRLTANMCRGFARRMGYSEEDALALEIAGAVHDWPEAVVGDKTYSDKTDADDELERETFKQYIESFYPNCPPEMDVVISTAVDEIIYSHSGEGLAKAFNAVERIGYMRTALRAAQRLNEGVDAELSNRLQWIIADAFGNHPAKLIELSGEFPPVLEYITAVGVDISRAFDLVEPSVFNNYPIEAMQAKINVFALNQIHWNNWRSSSDV